MDLSDLPDIIGSLSTSGAQWFKLVNSPSAVAVPGFAPVSSGAVQAQAISSGISGGTLLLFGGLAILAIVLLRK